MKDFQIAESFADGLMYGRHYFLQFLPRSFTSILSLKPH